MQKRKLKRVFLILIYSIVLVVISYCFFQREQTIENYNKEITKKTIYVINENLKKGDKISQKSINSLMIKKSIIPSNYIKSKEIDGLYARINIKKNTVLTKDMFLKDEIHKDDRYQNIKGIESFGDIKIGNYIDIRFKDKNEDIILFKKKKIIDYKNKYIKILTNEQERQKYLTCLNLKGTLYIVEYVDPFYQ